MQRRKLINKFFCFLYVLFINLSPVFSKDGDSHSYDMFLVLGLYSETDISSSTINKTILQPLFSKFNYYIDTLNISGYEGVSDNFYNEIKNNFAFAYEQQYTHRELYHWGFDFDIDLTENEIPTDNQIPQALRKTFEKYYGSYGEDVQSEWFRFLKFLRDEQAKRNESFTKSVKNTLGLRSSSDARDIAAIIYYTHILGDHIEHSGEHSAEAILELNKIMINLDTHINSLAKKCKWYYKDYKDKVRRISSSNDRDYAEEVINALSIYIPKILQFRFSNEFASKGLKFLYVEELLEVS